MKFSNFAMGVVLMAGSSNAFMIPSSSTRSISIHPSREQLRKELVVAQRMAFLDNLPKIKNIFTDSQDSSPPSSSIPPNFGSSEAESLSNTNDLPAALFSRAKSIISTDLGLQDATLLSPDFQWIGPNVIVDGPLSKSEYLAAGQYFDLRSTFPDLDLRAHDYRLDPNDPYTVRCTARTVGTMRGSLRLRSETLPPTGKRMYCPPEAISMTFDARTGLLTKLCSGFTMDRLVGNTAGLCGVMAAATVAGAPPSEWEIYPPATVVSRFFGRTVKQLEEPQDFLAPFPETVMIQLAKGVFASELGTKDPDLLDDGFTFCAPVVGPLEKKTFLEALQNFDIRAGLPDLTESYSNFRVDPYDPYRVWVDVKATGTRTGVLLGKEPNGAKYVGPPEAISLTFDDDGFCTRLTAGAVMDPTQCNTGGLGGIFGILYATGLPVPPLTARPLPQILSRLQKSILSPITGEDVDGFTKLDSSSATTVAPSPVDVQVEEKDTSIATIQEQSPAASTPKKEEEEKPKISPLAKLTSSRMESASIRAAPPSPPTPKQVTSQSKSKPVPISDDPVDPVTDAFTSIFGGGKSDDSSPPAAAAAKTKPSKTLSIPKPSKTLSIPKLSKTLTIPKPSADEAAAKKAKEQKDAAAAAAAKKKQLEIAAAKKAAAEERQRAAAARAEAAQKQAEEKKAAAEEKKRQLAEKLRQQAEAKRAAAEAKKKEAEEKRAAFSAAAAERKKKAMSKKATTTAERVVKEAGPGATISLGFFDFLKNDGDDDSVSRPVAQKASSAPRGVPTVVNWRQNRNGSISGVISGSSSFGDGESITTSPITSDAVEDSVVETSSGSRYYLSGPSSKASLFVSFGKKESDKPATVVETPKASPFGIFAKKKDAAPVPPVKMVGKPKKAAPVAAAKKVSKPPAGVPVFKQWKKNRDGSVTGLISGSNSFSQGEKVTTSPISSGNFEAGSVVVTSSGSKYYLS